MKLNKKVFAGALALAMGLGVAAPAVNSFAAPADSTMEIVEKEYRAAGEAWLKAYNELEDARAIEKDLKDKVDAADNAVQEATDKIVDLKGFKIEDTDEYKAYEAAVKAREAAEKRVEEKENSTNQYEKNKLERDLKAAQAKEAEALKAKDAKVQENEAELQAARKVRDEKAEALEAAKKAQKEATIKVDGEDLALGEAITQLEGTEKDARKKFKEQGANEDIINVMKKLGDVVLPDDEAEATEYEKVKKAYDALTIKLESLKFIKENLKETYKRYQEIFDKAEMAAEKALKDAKDYLDANKPMAFNLVNVAFADEGEKSADEILNQLEEADKLVDDALSKVEEDSKEQNDKDNGDKNDGAGKNDDGDKNDEPTVEEKTDKTPAKNVKTGVAGVAGVGAVLAAASAAYVSSKRK